MNEKLHGALDGTVPESELTAAEIEERDALARMIAGVVRSVPARPLPELGNAVLARLETDEASARPARRGSKVDRLLGWLWRPRAIVVEWRPAYAAFALAGVLAVGMAVPQLPGGLAPAGPTAEAGAGAGPVLVQFRLDAPLAQTVRLAGDFTGWKPDVSMVRSGNTWTVVVPLEPGVHDYVFVVDGERWVPDPMAPAVEDGFGGLNSRLAVLTAAS